MKEYNEYDLESYVTSAAEFVTQDTKNVTRSGRNVEKFVYVLRAQHKGDQLGPRQPAPRAGRVWFVS